MKGDRLERFKKGIFQEKGTSSEIRESITVENYTCLDEGKQGDKTKGDTGSWRIFFKAAKS